MASPITVIKSRGIDTTGDYVVNSISSTGNVSAGNIRTDHLLYANGTPYAFTSNAAGTNTQVQFNDANNFAGSANLTFNKTTGTLTANFFVGDGSQLTGLPASYTDTDANSAIDARVTKSFIDNLGVNANTLNGHSDTYFATSAQGNLADSALQPADLTGYATESFVGNAVANLVASAPAALDTLKELADALGNDASYATTITNALANKLSTSDFTSTADTWLGTKTTSNVTEGTNLYYTETRANASIDARVTKTFVDNLAVVANISNVAYSVDGSNVNGPVQYAAIANSVSASNIVGQVSNSLVAGTVYTNAQPNITSVGTLSILTVSGNVTANYFIGDGSQLTGLPAGYTDSDVETYLPSYAGNLSPGNLTVDVDNLTITGGSANYVLSTDGSGNLSWVTQAGGISILPEVDTQSFTANGSQNTFTLTTTPNNISYTIVHLDGVYQSTNNYSLTGNVVSFVDNIPADTVVEVRTLVQGSTSTTGFATTAGTVTASAQPNITSVGTLTGLSVSGDILPTANVTYDLGSTTQRFKDLYLSNNSIHLGDTIFNANSVLPFNLTIAPEVLTIQIAAPEAGNDTHWLWTWETSTLPYARAAITNQQQISVPLYKQGTYQINNFANEQTGNMTQRHMARLKWIDGAGLDNLVSWSVDAGNVTFSHPDINGGANTTVQRLNISVPSSITLPTLVAPNVTYDVSHANVDTFTIGNMGVGENRNLGPVYRGGTYTFNLASSLEGHPFYLTTDNGTGFIANSYVGEYTTGVTGSRNDGTTGKTTLTFVVPNNAPDTLYYQSATNANMRGAITIKDLAVETNINGNYVLYLQHMKEGHKTPIEIRPIPSMVNQMCLVYDQTAGKFVPQDMATYVENTPSFKNKIREVAGTATLIAPNGVAVVPTVLVVEDVSYLPLVNNKNGDIAFDSYTDTMYVWDTNAWKSTKPAAITASSLTGTFTNMTVAGNIIPSANVTYNLGNSTNRFKDLYLSGSTIDLAGAMIKTDANTGAIALVPQPTVAVPNPTALVISPSGTVATVSTTAGVLSANTVANAVANSASITTYGTISLAQAGNITPPFTGVARCYPTSNVTIVNVFASLGTVSSTNFGFTLKKNGSNVGNYTVSANSYRMTPVSANINVSTTDYLTIDITSGTGGTDLKVDLQYKLQ